MLGKIRDFIAAVLFMAVLVFGGAIALLLEKWIFG